MYPYTLYTLQLERKGGHTMFFLMIVMKLVIGLVALIIGARVLGKKKLAQTTPLDLIYVVVLSGVLIQAVYDEQVQLYHLLGAIALWCIMIYLIEYFVSRKEKARSLIKGAAVLLVSDSEMKVKAFIKHKMEVEQYRTLLRQQGVFSMSDVTYAILETNGGISVIHKEQLCRTPSILLANTGEYVIADFDQDRQRDEEWVREKLQEGGYSDISRIFCAEWSEENGLYVVLYPDKE